MLKLGFHSHYIAKKGKISFLTIELLKVPGLPDLIMFIIVWKSF